MSAAVGAGGSCGDEGAQIDLSDMQGNSRLSTRFSKGGVAYLTELDDAGDMDRKPQRYKPRLKYPPRKREIYWCDYPPPECAHLPEFWKRRPVVVISRRTTLKGVVTVVPLTSREQTDLRASVPVCSPIDGRDAWVICNHVTTVAVSRLLPVARRRIVIPAPKYSEIMAKVMDSLASP